MRIEQEKPCETCGGNGEVQIQLGTGNDRIPEIAPCPNCKPEEEER